MKNLLKMSDLSPAELTHILDVADQLKAQQKLVRVRVDALENIRATVFPASSGAVPPSFCCALS